MVISNRQPIVVNAIDDMEIYVTQSFQPISIASVFSDQDGDVLTYEVSSLDSSVLVATLNETALSFDILNAGMAQIEVTAWDGITEKIKTSFVVSVFENNVPVLSDTISDMFVGIDSIDIVLDLNDYFYDADADDLTFNVFTNQSDFVGWELNGSILNFVPIDFGVTNFMVIVNDNKSEEISAWFNFIVNQRLDCHK